MLYYSDIVLTVQRQAGKTELSMSVAGWNCLHGPNRRAWYTAQSGQHAAAKWREMSDGFVESPGTSFMATRRLTNGSEWLRFVNGSSFSPHPPTADSLHSKQSDLNLVDEGWWHSEVAGQALIQAIAPTTTTRRVLTGQQPQLWYISAEGTVESTWWNPIADAARAGHLGGRVAVFDFGIGPDDDPDDLDAVAAAHPGYPHIIDMETLRTARGRLGAAEFARAYGNRRTGSQDRLIPAAAFDAAQWRDTIPDGPTCYALAAGVDSIDATITVTTLARDGSVITAIPDGCHAPGTYWALDRLEQLTKNWPAPVVIDRVGPSASLHDAAHRRGLDLLPIGTSDVTGAVQTMMSGITNPHGPTWRVKPHEAFYKAAELATRRWVSDGAFLLGRRRSVGSISALEAAVLSAWGVHHLPTPRGPQIL